MPFSIILSFSSVVFSNPEGSYQVSGFIRREIIDIVAYFSLQYGDIIYEI